MKNYTSHDVNIVDEENVQYSETHRKYVSEKPVCTKVIPSSGVLSVQYDVSDGGLEDGVPIRIKRKVAMDKIPEGTFSVIVSALYATANPDPRIRTIIDPVFTPDGKKVIGCLAVGRVENAPLIRGRSCFPISFEDAPVATGETIEWQARRSGGMNESAVLIQNGNTIIQADFAKHVRHVNGGYEEYRYKAQPGDTVVLLYRSGSGKTETASELTGAKRKWDNWDACEQALGIPFGSLWEVF